MLNNGSASGGCDIMSNNKAYFVDIENVGSKDINSFLKHDKTSLVVLVTGPQVKLGGELLTELSKPKSRLEVVHSPITADQMADKLLLVKVGEYFAKYPNRDLIVVSKDKGFLKAADILSQHWSKEVDVISKLPSLSNKKKPGKNGKSSTQQKKSASQPKTSHAPSAKAEKSSKKNGNASASKDGETYWDIVKARKVANRAKSHDALISSIQNIRKSGLKSSADAIVNWLKQTGKLSIKDGKISWSDA